MKESIFLSPELNQYWSFIKNASDEIKLKLISLLSLSVSTHVKENKNNDDIDNLYGAWIGSETAEEIINYIKEYPSTKDSPFLD